MPENDTSEISGIDFRPARPEWHWARPAIWLIGLAGLGVLFYFLPHSIDWAGFYHAARTPFTPYADPVYTLHNPPWFVVPLVPLGWLPEDAGRAVNDLLIVLAVIFLVRKLRGNSLALWAALLSPPLVATVIVGNIEWLPIAGMLLGGAWAVPLLVIKPQVTLAVIPLEWRRAGYRWSFFVPTLGLLAISFLVWGFWPAQIPPLPLPTGGRGWNFSLWPWSIPFGLLAFWLAWRRDSPAWALTASVLLSPYFALGSLLAATTAWACRYPRAVAIMVLVFWIGVLTVLRPFG